MTFDVAWCDGKRGVHFRTPEVVARGMARVASTAFPMPELAPLHATMRNLSIGVYEAADVAWSLRVGAMPE